jgi:hypothetical protein
MSKQWLELGYINESDTGPYLSLNKNAIVKVDGVKHEGKSFNIARYIVKYDKESRQEVVVGKVVSRKKEDGSISEYVEFMDNVKFGTSEGRADVSKYAILKNKNKIIADIDAAEAEGKITEDKAEELRGNASNALFKVTLPPAQD